MVTVNGRPALNWYTCLLNFPHLDTKLHFEQIIYFQENWLYYHFSWICLPKICQKLFVRFWLVLLGWCYSHPKTINCDFKDTKLWYGEYCWDYADRWKKCWSSIFPVRTQFRPLTHKHTQYWKITRPKLKDETTKIRNRKSGKGKRGKSVTKLSTYLNSLYANHHIIVNATNK